MGSTRLSDGRLECRNYRLRLPKDVWDWVDLQASACGQTRKAFVGAMLILARQAHEYGQAHTDGWESAEAVEEQLAQADADLTEVLEVVAWAHNQK